MLLSLLHSLALATPETSALLPVQANVQATSWAGGDVVIVVSHGRGGSTVLCDTIAVLGNASNESFLRRELFGETPSEMLAQPDPLSLMRSYLSEQRAADPGAHYVGFKWKLPSLVTPAYDAVWRWVAEHGARIVLLHRNLLDTYLSTLRHAASGNGLSSHCHPGDAACVAEHQHVRVTPNTTDMLTSLEGMERAENESLAILTKYGVPHRVVYYEILFDGQKGERGFAGARSERAALEAWTPVLRFLGEPDPSSGYRKIAAAISATRLESTSAARTQCDSLTDADAVRTALVGTRYEGLLEC